MNLAKLICCMIIVFALPFSAFGQDGGDNPATAVADNQKEDYQTLLKDRDNLKAQMKILLQYKNEIVAAQQQLTRIENERAQWEMEKQSLTNQVQKLRRENDLLINKVGALQEDQFVLQEERDSLRQTLSKSKTGHIIVEDLNRRIKEQKKEISRFENRIKKMKQTTDSAEDRVAKAETTAEVLRGQVKEIKLKYKKAVAQNRILEKKLKRLPREYAEIARENKVLLKRTALMHYNLGVFYTKNKEYVRAIAEFEKTIELNPEDAQAYFNLGYIYAEFFEDRPKAIDNFQKYLRLAKKDDKDIDWVKKYILTWQTWEGKKITK